MYLNKMTIKIPKDRPKTPTNPNGANGFERTQVKSIDKDAIVSISPAILASQNGLVSHVSKHLAVVPWEVCR